MRWASTRDLYLFWPALATLGSLTDEDLREHLALAEASVEGDLRSLGFDLDRVDPEFLRRLVVYRALADILTYPLADRPSPTGLGRAGDYFALRYKEELRLASAYPGRVTRGLVRGTFAPQAFPLTRKEP